MEAWLDREESSGDDIPEWEDTPQDLLVSGEHSWDLYTLCSASQWSVLPEGGGWLDQPDSFLHDVGVFSRRMAYLKQLRKRNKRARQQAEIKLGLRDRMKGWRDR